MQQKHMRRLALEQASMSLQENSVGNTQNVKKLIFKHPSTTRTKWCMVLESLAILITCT